MQESTVKYIRTSKQMSVLLPVGEGTRKKNKGTLNFFPGDEKKLPKDQAEQLVELNSHWVETSELSVDDKVAMRMKEPWIGQKTKIEKDENGKDHEYILRHVNFLVVGASNTPEPVESAKADAPPKTADKPRKLGRPKKAG